MSQKTTILIPAYNEEGRISKVLDIITNYPADRIVVIDDGSIDATAKEALNYNVEILSHGDNKGKGAALQTGLDYVKKSDYWIFLDADLINLKTDHLTSLITPLEENSDVKMTVGMFTAGGKIHVDLAQRFFGILNGQRGLSQSYIDLIPNLNWARFGVEIFLSKYAQHVDAKVRYPVLEGITHWTKEEKYGFIKGGTYRLQMYYECLSSLKNWKNYIP